jgi:hypothetical protein
MFRHLNRSTISGNIHAVDGHALFGGNWKHLRTRFGVLHCHEQLTKKLTVLLTSHTFCTVYMIYKATETQNIYLIFYVDYFLIL